MLRAFKPANPVNYALFKAKTVGFYYGKPKPPQELTALGTAPIALFW